MRWSLFVLALSALPVSAQQPQRIGVGPNLYSREKESALGAAFAQQLQLATTPVNNPAALGYVQQVGSRLAAQLPEPRFTYTFALIAEDNNASKEPLALPGGYIYVPSSVLLSARDEAEFAGLLAHAMAHLADRDGTRQATRGTIGKLQTMPVIYLGGSARVLGASDVLLPVAFVQFSNTDEQQADALAVKMASGAGYDAEGLLRYLNHESPGDDRIAALRTVLQIPPPGTDDEFLRIQNQLRNPPRN